MCLYVFVSLCLCVFVALSQSRPSQLFKELLLWFSVSLPHQLTLRTMFLYEKDFPPLGSTSHIHYSIPSLYPSTSTIYTFSSSGIGRLTRWHHGKTSHYMNYKNFYKNNYKNSVKVILTALYKLYFYFHFHCSFKVEALR